jgi:hypothetical protein
MVRIGGGASAGGSVPTTKLVQISVQQDAISHNQAPPVFNTYNTHFDKAGGLTIVGVWLWQSNTETNSKNVTIKVTTESGLGPMTLVDEPIAHEVDTYLQIYLDPKSAIMNTSSPDFDFILASDTMHLPFKCKQFKLELKMTSALGTAQTLASRTEWAQEHLFAEA